MLDDIEHLLDASKRADLVGRLNNKRVEQALPAEMELALIWAMRDLDCLEVEPHWWVDGKRPDIYVEGFIKDTPTVVEIAATNDQSISGEDVMDGCVREVIDFANKILKGSGDFLYFSFSETRSSVRGRSIRGIAAPKNYKLSASAKIEIRRWLKSHDAHKIPLVIDDAGLSVVIEMKPFKQIRFHNFWTSRPPRTYSETNNSIYNLLKKKASQVERAPSGTKRIIFLADVGSRTLAEIGKRNWGPDTEANATASAIISRFLKDRVDRVDAVVVFSPGQKPLHIGRNKSAAWTVVPFSTHVWKQLEEGLIELKAQLPSPRYSGPQARSLFRQGAFSPNARGQYLGSVMTTDSRETTYRISARAFQDFLSGCITEKQFRHFIGDREDRPSIAGLLDAGLTISGARIIRAGVDEDDDHLEFRFAPDAAAKPFT